MIFFGSCWLLYCRLVVQSYLYPPFFDGILSLLIYPFANWFLLFFLYLCFRSVIIQSCFIGVVVIWQQWLRFCVEMWVCPCCLCLIFMFTWTFAFTFAFLITWTFTFTFTFLMPSLAWFKAIVFGESSRFFALFWRIVFVMDNKWRWIVYVYVIVSGNLEIFLFGVPDQFLSAICWILNFIGVDGSGSASMGLMFLFQQTMLVLSAIPCFTSLSVGGPNSAPDRIILATVFDGIW